MAKLNLNLNDVKVSTGGTKSDFAIVPSGKYTVIVAMADTKETKGGAGSALILGYKIIDGEFTGKAIKDFLNVVNPSAEAQRISLERLATVAWATNAPMTKGVLADSDDLLEKEPFEIVVEQVDDGEYKNMKVKAVICTRSLEVKEEVKETKKASAPWKVTK